MKAKLILLSILHFILLAIYWICTLLSKGFSLTSEGIDKLLNSITEYNQNNNKESKTKIRITIPIEIQREVFSRSNYRCQKRGCLEKGSFHIHHIDNNPSNNNIHNLIHLCPNHHHDAGNKLFRSWQLRDWSHGRYE